MSECTHTREEERERDTQRGLAHTQVSKKVSKTQEEKRRKEKKRRKEEKTRKERRKELLSPVSSEYIQNENNK